MNRLQEQRSQPGSGDGLQLQTPPCLRGSCWGSRCLMILNYKWPARGRKSRNRLTTPTRRATCLVWEGLGGLPGGGGIGQRKPKVGRRAAEHRGPEQGRSLGLLRTKGPSPWSEAVMGAGAGAARPGGGLGLHSRGTAASRGPRQERRCWVPWGGQAEGLTQQRHSLKQM